MHLCTSSGSVVSGRRWVEPADAVDARVLAGVAGPVLDVGCGPGRHVRSLHNRGVVALGIDLTPEVVAQARARGVDVLERCVFGPVPATGRWRTALLLDGNIGIGGDPVALLRRIRELLAPDGRVLVETAAPGISEVRGMAYVEAAGRRGPTFGWQTVATDRLVTVATSAAMAVERAWCDGGRWFSSVGPAVA